MMPGGMDGKRLAEAAARDRRDLKVLFTTGYSRNATGDPAPAGNPGTIGNPSSFDALASLVRATLDGIADDP
jgi:hypothetical protein